MKEQPRLRGLSKLLGLRLWINGERSQELGFWGNGHSGARILSHHRAQDPGATAAFAFTATMCAEWLLGCHASSYSSSAAKQEPHCRPRVPRDVISYSHHSSLIKLHTFFKRKTKSCCHHGTFSPTHLCLLKPCFSSFGLYQNCLKNLVKTLGHRLYPTSLSCPR